MEYSKVRNVYDRMMDRCYDTSDKSYGSYGAKGVTVCEEWHDFDNFRRWYEENYYTVGNETMCLDKDLKYFGNKEYSPEKCIIIPISINNSFVGMDLKGGDIPTGVRAMKSGRFSVTVSTPTGEKRTKYIGSFDTVEKATRVYKTHKIVEVLKLLRTYKGEIPEQFYNAVLMSGV